MGLIIEKLNVPLQHKYPLILIKMNTYAKNRVVSESVNSLNETRRPRMHAFFDNRPSSIAQRQILKRIEDSTRGTHSMKFPPCQLKSQGVIQRELYINGEEITWLDLPGMVLFEKGRTVMIDEADVEYLQLLMDSMRILRFNTLAEAVNVGKMVKEIKDRQADGTYRGGKTSNELRLNTGLLSILEHFRDPDHDSGGLSSVGEYSAGFDIEGLLSEDEILTNDNVKDTSPASGRQNEALLTAIKLKSMNLKGRYKLYGRKTVDYVLEDESSENQYAFDPFELPRDARSSESQLDESRRPRREEDPYESFFGDPEKQDSCYEDHVRHKMGNVSSKSGKAYYCGLLDVSGISVDNLYELIDAIYRYEQGVKAENGENYVAPHLSLINSWLQDNNVADFDFEQEYQTSGDLVEDISALFS